MKNKINFPVYLLSNYRNNNTQERKHILLLFLFVICFASANAQLRSELNLPRAGDELVKEQVTFIEPGDSGENQLWDFSKITSFDDAYTVNYFTRDDWKIVGAEAGKLSFLSISGDSMLLSGYENPNTLVRYNRPGLLLHFPVEYGAASQGRFQGRGKHHDRIESIISGKIQTIADASGSIILPGNDTLNNVIRIHIRKIENSSYIPITSEFDIDLPANDSLFSGSELQTIFTDTYQWYEDGYRYPVFETVETYCNTTNGRIVLSSDAYFYHPAEQAFLPEDEANQVVLERKAAAKTAKLLEKTGNIISLNCYPNPVKNHLTTELNLRQPANVDVTILDMNGRPLLQLPSKTNVRYFRETLDMQSYSPGYYLVKISAGKETTIEKIVKN